MPLGLLLTHPPQVPPFLKESYNTTTQTLQDNSMFQQQWPWLPPSGQTPETSAASHLPISYTLLFYLTSKIVSPCWCTSVVYHNFLSVLEEKHVKPCGKFRDVLLSALQTLTSLLYFFLLENSSWLLYIVIMLMMTMITYLLTVQGALLPACVCMKGVLTVWQNGGGCDEDDHLGNVCYCYNVECFFVLFFSFLLVHERFMRCVRVHAFEHLSAPVREVKC